MLDYVAAVVAAVKTMLSESKASPAGVTSASRKGADRTLACTVSTLIEWLQTEHAKLGLHNWDAARRIGLPRYDLSKWGSPVGAKPPAKASAAWKAFHEKWVAPALKEQREKADGKRQEPEEEGPEEEGPDQMTVDDLFDSIAPNLDVRGDLVVDGVVTAHSFHTRGADVRRTRLVPHARSASRRAPTAPAHRHPGPHRRWPSRSRSCTPTRPSPHARSAAAAPRPHRSLPRADAPALPPSPRQVVGLFGDKVSLKTTGSRCVGVVSESPGVLCGADPPGSAKDKVNVLWAGWQGQVQVLVAGAVSPGDVLVPSGKNDGLAVAVSNARKGVLGIVARVDDPALGAAFDPAPRSVLLLMGTSTTAIAQPKGRPPASPPSATSWDLCDVDAASDVAKSSSLSQASSGFDEIVQMMKPAEMGSEQQQTMMEMLQSMQAQMDALASRNRLLCNQLEVFKELHAYPNDGAAAGAIKIMQKLARGLIARLALKRSRRAACTLQRASRGCLARSVLKDGVAAAVRLQQSARRRLCLSRYGTALKAVTRIQATGRGRADRRGLVAVNGAATRLQAAQRRHVDRQAHVAALRAAGLIQRSVRGYAARLLHNPRVTKTSLQLELIDEAARAAGLEAKIALLEAAGAEKDELVADKNSKIAQLEKAAAEKDEQLAKLIKSSAKLVDPKQIDTSPQGAFRRAYFTKNSSMNQANVTLPAAMLGIDDRQHCAVVRIEDYANLRCEEKGEFHSSSFTLGGFEWHLEMYPRGHSDGKGTHLSMYLKSESSGKVKAKFSLGLLNANYLHKNTGGEREFDSSDWGFHNFLPIGEVGKYLYKGTGCAPAACHHTGRLAGGRHPLTPGANPQALSPSSLPSPTRRACRSRSSPPPTSSTARLLSALVTLGSRWRSRRGEPPYIYMCM